MYNFSSFFDFKDAIEEINILITNAKENEKVALKYRTYNKASIVLVCGKFESFLESFLEEYCYEILSNYTNIKLEKNIKNHLTEVLINELEKKKNNTTKREEIILRMSQLYSEIEILCNDFSIDCKFNYGKHGEEEIKRLLKRFGFNEFAESDDNKNFFTKFI